MADSQTTRYAFDQKYKVQYRLSFNGDKLTSVRAFGPLMGMDLQNALGTGRIVAIDDATMEREENGKTVEARPVYKIKLKVEAGRLVNQKGEIAVESYEVDGINPATPLPAQHTTATAKIARQHDGGSTRPNPNQTQPNPNGTGGLLDDFIKDILGGPTQPIGNKPAPKPVTPVDPADPPRRRRAGEMRQPMGRTYSTPDSVLERMLKEYGTDLTARARMGELDPTIGREKERRDVRQLLLRKGRASVMLLGEAGVGKTEIFKAIAQDIVNGNAEAELKDARVITLNLQAMTAGTQFRGEFEKRLMPILDGLEERGGYINGQKIVLCIDEIHNALTAGSAMGAKGAGEIMKPFLSEGSVTCIGATTYDEYVKHIEKDKALVRRFAPYTIEEPINEEALEIIEKVQEQMADYHWLEQGMSTEDCEYVMRMTNRFMPNFQQPDKGISVIDDAMAIARSEGKTAVEQKHIVSAISKASGLKEEFLNQSDFEKYAKLEENLKAAVIGQDEALEELAANLRTARMGLTKEDAPRGVFLMPGPTGVGKTETAKRLAELLTGDKANVIRLDMNEYSEKHTASRLLGAPPGFVGHDEEGQLTGPVRKKPFSVILLDEAEKAHPDVWKTFLSIFDDGEVKDNKGKQVDFRNTIILMTSNLGAEQMQSMLSGPSTGMKFGSAAAANDSASDAEIEAKEMAVTRAKIKEIAMGAIKRHFKPEFVNRLDGVVPYNALSKSAFNTIVDIRLKKVQDSLRHDANGLQLTNAEFEVTDKVRDVLREKGYDKQYGARPLERAMVEHMTSKLADWMIAKREMLVEQNKKGPFKIKIEDLGENFNAKVVAVKTKANDNKPKAAAKPDKPAA